MDNLPPSLDWSLVQAFLAVAETGSLSGAAARLGTSQPTLGRQIRKLEQDTGLTLFARHPRGLNLTEEGHALLPAASRMSAAMAEVALAVAGQDAAVSGTVRITASEVVAHHILPRIIAEISADHPAISIDLVASDDSNNLLFREADIALRMYRSEQLDIVTRRLGGLELAVFAAESYLERAGVPTGPADLRGHRLIGFDRSDLILRSMRSMGWDATRDDFAIRCDNQVNYWELLRCGGGIGFYQAHVGRAAPEVRELDLGVTIPPLPLWLAAHQTVRRTPRIDLVWRALERGLGPYLIA